MTSAAMTRRSSVSHQGLFEGVSSFFSTRARILSGGNTSMRGRGGVMRRSHQITGRATRPKRTAGAGEGEGKGEHQPAFLPSPGWPERYMWMVTSASEAGRSVRCVTKVQPRWRSWSARLSRRAR